MRCLPNIRSLLTVWSSPWAPGPSSRWARSRGGHHHFTSPLYTTRTTIQHHPHHPRPPPARRTAPSPTRYLWSLPTQSDIKVTRWEPAWTSEVGLEGTGVPGGLEEEERRGEERRRREGSTGVWCTDSHTGGEAERWDAGKRYGRRGEPYLWRGVGGVTTCVPYPPEESLIPERV